MFDIEESLHLAIHAGAQGKHDVCIAYLKDVLRQQPDHAVAIYLLAVQHAELGMVERAIDGMRTAVSLQPGLEIARFQLGLLLTDRNRGAEAKEQFTQLGASAEPALRAYAEGMIELIEERWSSARDKLAAGLAKSSGNAALTSLVTSIVAGIDKRGQAASPSAEVRVNDLTLGAYRKASQ